MKFMLVFMLIVSALLLGCATIGESCKFQYTDELKKIHVLPYLKENVGSEMLPFFNVDNPVLTDKGEVTRVVVSPIKVVDGRMVMYENSFIFIFKNCTGELVEAFKVVRN